MPRQTQAALLTLLVVLFWSTAATAFKIGLRLVTPYTLLLYSVAISTLVLLLILILQGKLAALRRTPAQVLVRAALLGILNPWLYYLVLFKAYSLLPGQIAMSLNYGWPLVLTLLSVPILGQTLAKTQVAAVAVSFFGAILIATQGQYTGFGELSRLGLLLAGGSTLIWATFWLFNAQDGLDPVIKLLVGFSAGLGLALLASPWFGGLVLPPPQAWLPLIYIGLFEMGITFVLWLTALQLSATAARIGNLVYVTPFLSLLFLRLVLGEPIHGATCIGLALIVGSILSQQWQTRCADKKNPPPPHSAKGDT
jgi:drug/metabolite transporter (DMT)-like permease